MLRSCLAVALACAAAVPVSAAAAAAPVRSSTTQIDYATFRALAVETEAYRQARLIDWNQWLAAAAQRDVLILDARSERQFAAGHMAGAVNVPLPEFSVERLAEVIGDSNRPILIYCNNNFLNDRPPVISKAGPVALNIPTFLHLVAYGYRNVRELDAVLDIDDPTVPWVTSVEEAAISSPPPSRAR
jgi:phage shock protein E